MERLICFTLFYFVFISIPHDSRSKDQQCRSSLHFDAQIISTVISTQNVLERLEIENEISMVKLRGRENVRIGSRPFQSGDYLQIQFDYRRNRLEVAGNGN